MYCPQAPGDAVMVCSFCGQYIWCVRTLDPDHIRWTNFEENKHILRNNEGKTFIMLNWATLEVHYYRVYDGSFR